MSERPASSSSDQTWRQILDNLPDIVVQLSPENQIEYISPAVQVVLGHAVPDLLGRNALELIHPDDQPQVYQSLQAGYQSGAGRLEFRVRHAQGHYVWLEAANKHLLSPQGAAASLILVLRDITERREAEQALYSRQRYYRALIENTSDLITVVDTSGIVRYQSPASEAALGYAPEDLVGRNAFDLLHPEDQPSLWEQFQRLGQGDSIQAAPIEVRARHRDGSWRTFEVTASGLMTLGVVEGIVATARDVTERRQMERAEREQRELADALRDTAAVLSGSLELNEVLDRILANVGRVVPHEMSSIWLVEGEMVRLAHFRDTLGVEWPADPRTLREPLAGQPALQRMLALPRAEITADTGVSPGWKASPGFDWVRSSIVSPIRSLGAVLGFLRLDSGLPDFFLDKHTERLMAFADQAAIAIENARLFENLDVEKQRLELLFELSQNLAASLDLFEVSTRALDLLTSRLGALQGELFFVAPGGDDLTLAALSHHDAASVMALNQKLGLKRGQGLAGWVMETRRPAIVPDTRADPHWVLVPGVDDHVRSVISVPLLAGDELVGVLNIVSERLNFFSGAEIPLLTAVTTPMALALQNARLFQERTQALAREQRLNAMARAINSTLSLPTVLHEMLRLAIEITGAEAAALGMVVDGAIVVQPDHVVNLPDAAVFPRATPTASLSWHVVETRRPLIVRDYAAHPLAIPPLIQAGVHEALGVPVVAGDDCIGVIGLYHLRPDRHFVERDLAMAESVGLQAGIAIQNARLFEERTQALAREQRLNEVARIISGTLDLATILRDVVRLTTELISAEAGALSLVEGDELVIQTEATVNFPEYSLAQRIPHDASVLSWEVVETGKALLIRDYARHPRALPNLVAAGVREVIAAPVAYGQNRLGVLAVYHLSADRTFTERDLALTESVGRQAGIAVQNARVFEDAQQRATELAALYRASAPLLHTTDLHGLAQQIVTAVSEEFEHAHCSVLLLDDDAQELRPIAQRDRSTSDVVSFPLRLYGPGLIPAAVRSGESLYAADVEKDPRYLRGAASTRSELVLPLRAGHKVIGVLNLESNRPDAFGARERRVLETFAERAGLALQNAQLFTAAQQNAAHLGLLNAITQAAVETREFGGMLQTLVERVCKVIQADSATITLWDEARQQAVAGAATFSIREMYQVTAPLPEEPTITQAVIKAQRTLIIEDALASPYISPRLAAAFPIRSCLGIPLMAGDQILGACIIAFHQPHHFNLDEVMRSEQAAGQVALGVANGQLLLRLEQARKVAEEASRLKSEFLANTSHELRTPLNGILGSLKLVLDDLCDTPEEERQFVGTAYEAARRLLRIIDDLLDIAKIEAGKMEVALQAVDVAPLLLDVYNLTQAQAGQKGLAFAVEAPPATAPRVWANAESLRQILLNLVGNALKFTERGHVRVRSRVEPGQRQMHLLVEDTGIGIAPEAQARLFAPFVQADGSTTRQYGGTGLGLSISRRLAELMGGTLTLHSAGEGQGSTFTLTLPLVSHGE